jgi:hypothetical protein
MHQNNGLSELGMAVAELNEAGVETLVQKGLDQKIAPEQIFISQFRCTSGILSLYSILD